MRLLIASALGVLLLVGCAEEKSNEVSNTVAPTESVAPPTETVATTSTVNENQISGIWSGQIKVADPVSMFNYVGPESGDFAPMRFRNDSEAGKKILAVCANDDLCEFTGVIEWLDETPPPDASAIGQIVSVESVKRLPPPTQ